MSMSCTLVNTDDVILLSLNILTVTCYIFKTVSYVLNMFSVLFHAYNEDWYRWM